ncbi:MAG: hypothetical protein DRP26_05020 [Candidatus Zixiibacteriota bacterium]|nr:MAG: hypothetical protein DRP26_05020 [candidate division Zixibacteria bacterium]
MLYRALLISAITFLMLTDIRSADRNVTINIYNGGFSQVMEKRKMKLVKGENTLVFYDIAEKIDPGSITLNAADFDIQWLDYNYDFVSLDRLLTKFIDKEIRFQKDDSVYSGMLIRYDKDHVFVAENGWPGAVSIYEIDDLKKIVLPDLPGGLVSRPTINARGNSKISGREEIEISYLTTGLGWKAEYNLNLDDKNKAEFSGWVNLDNQCGVSFPKATIVLVAGQVEREKPTAGGDIQNKSGEESETFKSILEPLVDYHRYTLPFKTPLKEQETKQAVMFQPLNIKVDRYYKYQWSETKSDAKSVVAFKNDVSSGLGFALPPGRISIYDKRSDTFLGSGLFDGAPAGEKIEVFIGTAFDIKVERKRIDHKKIARDKNSDTFEIKIRNHKPEEIKMVIAEELYGYWEIVKKSDDFDKKDFQTIEFEILVPAAEEKTITYTVEYGY